MRQLILLLIIVFLIAYYSGKNAATVKGSPAEREVKVKKSASGDTQQAKRDNFIAGLNRQAKPDAGCY